MASSTTVPSLDVTANALKDLGVWNDILPDVNPSQLKGVLEIKYPSGVSIYPVATPHRDEVQGEPKAYFHGEVSYASRNCAWILIKLSSIATQSTPSC